MKRRNFLGFTGLAALPLIPGLARRTQAQESKPRTVIQPSVEGRVLPAVKAERRGHNGTLCPANAQRIAAKIEEVFGGEKIVIAKHGGFGLDVETDAELTADWCDHSESLVKAATNEKDDDARGIRTSICFSCGDSFYIFDSRAKSPHDRENFKYAYFYFDGDKLTIKQRAPGLTAISPGQLCEYIFRVQHEDRFWCGNCREA